MEGKILGIDFNARAFSRCIINRAIRALWEPSHAESDIHIWRSVEWHKKLIMNSYKCIRSMQRYRTFPRVTLINSFTSYQRGCHQQSNSIEDRVVRGGHWSLVMVSTGSFCI